MDVVHIEARYKDAVVLPRKCIDAVGQHIVLATTVQFLSSLTAIKQQLIDAGKVVRLFTGRRATYEGQLLGCMTQEFSFEEGEEILYVGDGQFHPKALLLNNAISLTRYNPHTGEIRTFSQEDVQTMKKKFYGSYAAFLQAKDVGILVSTKFGQCKPSFIEELEKKFPDKTFYTFVADTFDFASLENFPFVKVFVNTMCERIGFDDSMVQGLSILNAEDVMSELR